MAHVLNIIDNHPLGKLAFRKRGQVYRQQGFVVRDR
jgi:hypothetical protein